MNQQLTKDMTISSFIESMVEDAFQENLKAILEHAAPNKVMSLKEIEAEYNIKPRTIRRAIDEGELPFVSGKSESKTGKYFVLKYEIDNWNQSRQRKMGVIR